MIDPAELDELILLLPFYVNGTLDSSNRARIDAELPQSPELRDALLHEYALKDRIVAGVTAAINQTPERETARAAMLNARASAATTSPANVAENVADTKTPSAWARALSVLNPRRWHPAVALSLALAIPAQAAVIASQSSHIAWLQDENFRLASGPCDDAVGGGHLLVEIKDGVAFNALTELLSREGLKIVAVSDLGTVTVKTAKEGAELTAQMERLRTSPIIASADPAA